MQNAIRREMSLGDVNGLGLRIVEVTDSTIAKLATGSIRSLIHLEVAPMRGNRLQLNELEVFGLSQNRFKRVYDAVCLELRHDRLRQHFLPGLKLADLGRILNGDFTTQDGEVHIRFGVGHKDLIARLWPNDLWTGFPFPTHVETRQMAGSEEVC
jgi:hypothetical protein